ncbi:MAG: DUF1858 domain-containing protein [Deltaproteobacteria bacterium]|nr:DUF1858 domain-containing protein [Deltaproteobacteria bacterium]
MPGRKGKINEEMNIGEVLSKYPETREIFRQHFGPGCFNCPGSLKETIYFGALMHNKDAGAIVRDLNARINSKGRKGDAV